MSFSFAAAGTKEETVSSLSKANTGDTHLSDHVKQFLINLIGDDKSHGGDTHHVRYEVSANGHGAPGVPGTTSYANISYVTKLVPNSEPADISEPELQVGGGH